MIDFSNIEPYFGPLQVEDLDAAVAMALNPDTAPDATHTNNLITSAAVANQILYYSAQTVNTATNAQILRIPASGTDSKITTDTVVLECTFANADGIKSAVSWQSYDGYVAFTGTCEAATTADVTLGRKGN